MIPGSRHLKTRPDHRQGPHGHTFPTRASCLSRAWSNGATFRAAVIAVGHGLLWAPAEITPSVPAVVHWHWSQGSPMCMCVDPGPCPGEQPLITLIIICFLLCRAFCALHPGPP